MNKKIVVILWIIAIIFALLVSSQSSKYLNYNENTTIPSSYPAAKAQILLDQKFNGGNANNTIDIVLINVTPEQIYQIQKMISNISGITRIDSIVTVYLEYDQQLGKIINLTGYLILEHQRNITYDQLRYEIAKILNIPFTYTALFNTTPESILNQNETLFFEIKPPANLTSLYLAKNVSVIYVYTKYGANFQFRNGTYPDEIVSDHISKILKNNNVSVKYYLTGPTPLVEELSQSENERQAITFISVFIVLLVIMGVYFRSLLAPIIAMSIIGLSMIFGLAIVTLVGELYHQVDFQVIEPMISILLGIGADYSIFLLSRFKEELAKGNNKEEAMKISVKTSGRAILISGTAVTLVFLSLSFIPYLHSWGLTIGFSVPIAVLLAVSLLPIIYGKIGAKIFWPSKPTFSSNKTLGKIAEVTMRKPKTTLAIASVLGVLALFFVLSTPLSLDFTSGLPNLPAVEGLKVLDNAFGNSFVNPILIVFNNSYPINTSYLIKIASLENNISRLEGVKSLIGPVPINFNGTYTPEVIADLKANVGEDNRTLLVTVITSYNAYSAQAQKLANTLQIIVKPYNGYVGGTTAIVVDALEYLLPYYEMLIVILPIVLIISLAVFLRSLKISIGAVGTILLSIVLSLSIVYGLYKSSEGVLFFIPITIYVLMMGLGNDYSIFILTRVKEEIEKERSIDSIIRAISISAGAVTALGVILAASFGVLGIDPIKPIQELGIGIAIAALLDTFIIRIFIYPAILKIALKIKTKT